MIIQNKKITASILFVLISFVCFGQAGPPPPAPPPPPGLPINDAIPFVIIIALWYGIKIKLAKSKQKNC